MQLTDKTVVASAISGGRAARARVGDSVAVRGLDSGTVKDEQDQQQTKAAF